MKKWIALIALGTSMLAVLAVEAGAAEASYRPVGKVNGLKVQAGNDTSAGVCAQGGPGDAAQLLRRALPPDRVTDERPGLPTPVPDDSAVCLHVQLPRRLDGARLGRPRRQRLCHPRAGVGAGTVQLMRRW